MNINFSYSFERPAVNAAYRLGFWSALCVSVIGVIYFFGIVGALLAGKFTSPPPEWLQLFGAFVSLTTCPILIGLMASLHAVTPPEKKVLSQIALGFTLLFAMAVTINRFTQLGVVRQSVATGKVDGLNWFLPHGERSVMLSLEYLGWSWFLALAFICAAPLFSHGTLERWLRGLLLLYGVLALMSAVGFLTGSLLSLLGFVAWGVVLIFITALLAIYFKRAGNYHA